MLFSLRPIYQNGITQILNQYNCKDKRKQNLQPMSEQIKS